MEQVKEGVWVIHSEVKVAPGTFLPLQTSIVRLPDQTLLIYSPIRFSEQDLAVIRVLGDVRHIVAPNLMHHLFFGPAAAAFPDATTWAAPGLAAKRPDLKFDQVLSADTNIPGVQFIAIDGIPVLNEFVMFAHNTLFCADLFMNIHSPKNLPSKLASQLAGTYQRVAISRLLKVTTRDSQAFRASVVRVLQLPFSTLVPCHGDIVLSDAHTLCTQALNA